MSAARNGRRHGRLVKATALLPLAVLSVAWTTSIAGVGGPTLASIAEQPQQQQPQPVLPDGTSLPSQAIEAPASVSDQASLGLGGGTNATQIVSTASTSGIPSAALAAYQRAETVINAADTTCALPWQLVAAIGRVESNHGRFDGNVLGDDGVATPGIYGVALDGAGPVALINDTDAGQYDNDTVFDRAIGPMQFIPSTWAVVGVDADGDGTRNPQDVDDAALGSAVYLCSGEDDLSTDAGQRAAIYRYNNSDSYVDLVLSVMQAYTAGDFTTIPNSAVAAGQLVAAAPPVAPEKATKSKVAGGKKSTGTAKTPTAPKPPTPPAIPTPTPAPAPPTDKGNDGKGGGGKGGGKGPTANVPPLPVASIPPVDQVLNLAEATAQCTLENPLELVGPTFEKCLDDYMRP